MKTKPIIRPGLRIDRIVVLEYAGTQWSGNPMWLVRCDCGIVKKRAASGLRANSKTKSCGCLRTTHGYSVKGKKHSPGYKCWRGMRQRCLSPANNTYARYGGRGIKICDRWLNFSNFVADMGEPAAGKTIERIDNDKGYSKENCRWASMKEQCQNRGSSVFVEYNGQRKTMAEWSEISGIKYATLRNRIIAQNKPLDVAFNMPLGSKAFSKTKKPLSAYRVGEYVGR